MFRFLLAPLYLNLLRDKMTPNEVQETIKQLREQSRSLNTKNDNNEVLAHVYQHVMNRISQDQPGRNALAMKVLMWLTCAKRQLKTLELQEALAINQDSYTLHPHDFPHPTDMVSVCAGLVTVDKESGIIRLVHYTTQEYLKSTRENWFPQAETTIARACIAYLSFWSLQPEAKTAIVRDVTAFSFRSLNYENYAYRNKFPFFSYAASEWGHHAQSEERSTLLIAEFLMRLPIYAATTLSYFLSLDMRKADGPHLATHLGLAAVMEELIQHHGGLGPTLDYPSLLRVAASRGHASVVKILLRAGATANDTDSDGDGVTALMVASIYDHLDIVHVLIGAGADVNATDRVEETALLKAVKHCHVHVVKALLASGAMSKSVSRAGETALIVAVQHGYMDIVDNLLAKGADPNTTTKTGKTALMIAIQHGHTGIIGSLLAKGADLNATDETGKTALITAIWCDQIEIFDHLLAVSKGDIAIPNNTGRMALVVAAQQRCIHIINSLLAQGADPNAMTKTGETALMVAAWHG